MTTKKVEVVSPAKSLKGWRFGKWFVGNWKTIKELLKIGIPALIGYVATHNPALIGLVTIGGKFLLDLGEYYWKEYTETK